MEKIGAPHTLGRRGVASTNGGRRRHKIACNLDEGDTAWTYGVMMKLKQNNSMAALKTTGHLVSNCFCKQDPQTRDLHNMHVGYCWTSAPSCDA